jgi:hypothetical protein
MIKRMLVGTFILFAILLLMLPKTDETSKKKMASAGMLMCSNDFRKAVTERLQRGEALDLQFDNSCPKLIAALQLDDAGVITLHGAQHGVTLVLTPRSDGGAVRWSCRGQPAELVTKLCKP